VPDMPGSVASSGRWIHPADWVFTSTLRHSPSLRRTQTVLRTVCALSFASRMCPAAEARAMKRRASSGLCDRPRMAMSAMGSTKRQLAPMAALSEPSGPTPRAGPAGVAASHSRLLLQEQFDFVWYSDGRQAMGSSEHGADRGQRLTVVAWHDMSEPHDETQPAQPTDPDDAPHCNVEIGHGGDGPEHLQQGS